MQKIFLTADEHYNHPNIIGYCKRPFKDIYEMNKKLICKNNKIVKPTDVVIHIGDFMLYNCPSRFDDVLKSLNGSHILLRGNHDRKSQMTSMILRTHGLGLFLCHNPPKENPYGFQICISGHHHEKYRALIEPDPKTKEIKYMIVNVGVDAWDFYPVSLDFLAGSYIPKIIKKFQREGVLFFDLNS